MAGRKRNLIQRRHLAKRKDWPTIIFVTIFFVIVPILYFISKNNEEANPIEIGQLCKRYDDDKVFQIVTIAKGDEIIRAYSSVLGSEKVKIIKVYGQTENQLVLLRDREGYFTATSLLTFRESYKMLGKH